MGGKGGTKAPVLPRAHARTRVRMCVQAALLQTSAYCGSPIYPRIVKILDELYGHPVQLERNGTF